MSNRIWYAKSNILLMLCFAVTATFNSSSVSINNKKNNAPKAIVLDKQGVSLATLKQFLAEKEIVCPELDACYDDCVKNKLDAQKLKTILLSLVDVLSDPERVDLSEKIKGHRPSLCLDNLSLDGDLIVHGVICCDNPSEGCSGTEVVAQFIPPLANNDFACTRAGEEVTIDILANDVAGTNPIDPATVNIVKDPDHAYEFLVDPVTGVVSYTANTRFTGQDEFAYTVSDTEGNPSPHIATVTVDVRCTPPATDNPRFIYSVGTAIYMYNAGVTTLLTDNPLSNVNAMATNRDDNLIYYAQETFIYAYDYIAGTHFTVADITGSLFPPGDINLTDGGATYFDGVYYVAGSDNTTGYYRIALDPYVPGTFAQSISNVYFVEWGDGFSREMADIQYDPISGNLIVISSNTGGPADKTVSVITPDSGVVLAISPFPDNGTGDEVDNMQIARGPNNVFYVSLELEGTQQVSTPIRAINPSNGQFTNNQVFPTIDTNNVFDMSEYICQPCSGLIVGEPMPTIIVPVGSSIH